MPRFQPLFTSDTPHAWQYWRQWAACRRTDPELFFPISNSGPSLDQVTRAKAVCAACRVRPDCLAFALRTGQNHGIWGGMTEDERRAAATQAVFLPRPARSNE